MPDPPKPLTIEVTLPKNYGLGGLDRAFGESEDYGSKNVTVTVPVSAGTFAIEFPPVAYHITFWLLPPLGAFPRHPPSPVYVASFSDAPHEVYLVGMNHDQFDYRVYDRTSRRQKPKSAATWSFVHGEYVPIESGKKKVWHLRIKITKPDLAFESGPPSAAAQRQR